MTYAPKPSYESLEETIDDLKSRLHAATSKDGCKCVCHEYPEPSALARHDAELRAEFQDEIQALNEQIMQMKAEFAARWMKINDSDKGTIG